MTFYLGTHEPSWLRRPDVNVPLFVSANRLRRLKRTRPEAITSWALDSGGFTELARHGRWTITSAEYRSEVLAWRDEIGHLDWAAPQDWMCEPSMVAKTGLTVAHHQLLTVQNFIELDHPIFIPVIQGWRLHDYLTHVDLYARNGIDLTQFDTVGVGSVCRRGQDGTILRILRTLTSLGIRCHGFGVRGPAYRDAWSFLASADSMAWSMGARLRRHPLPGCTHKSCVNCPRFALRWRELLLSGRQGSLFDVGGAPSPEAVP